MWGGPVPPPPPPPPPPQYTETLSPLKEILSAAPLDPFHRTMVGRGRAWLRFVLMQKKMADHFKMMTDNKRALR